MLIDFFFFTFFFTLFLFNNLWCFTLLSPLSYPGEMSLGRAPSVKLASLTECSAKRPCFDWHGIPWLSCVRLLPSLFPSPHPARLLKLYRYLLPSTPQPIWVAWKYVKPIIYICIILLHFTQRELGEAPADPCEPNKQVYNGWLVGWISAL